jgi:hypothetical protein
MDRRLRPLLSRPDPVAQARNRPAPRRDRRDRALGAVIWANIGLFTSRWFVRLTGGTWGILIFGPALLMQSYALAVTLQQGLLGRQFPDERREWWSRAGAWVLIYSFGWAIFSVVVMLVPFWVLYGATQLPLDWDLAKKVLAALWAAITAGGVMAAKADNTGNAQGPAPPRSRWIRWLPLVAPYVFILGLAIMLSLGVFLLLTRVLYPGVFGPDVKLHAANFGQYWCLMYGGTQCGDFVRHYPELPRPLLALLLAVVGGGVALLLAWRVDVNEFSMHHFYKNRLVRCYLGGTRGRNRRGTRSPASIPTTTSCWPGCISRPGRHARRFARRRTTATITSSTPRSTS